MAVSPPSGSPAAPSAVTPGRLIGGRYRLESVLASGGMAQVWQATDEVLRRSVAVKILHPHLAADATFVARFRQEAVAAARLAHPSIVNIYDTCSEGGLETIVMELVRGPTLRDRLDEGPLEPLQAARIAAQVADALDVAHRAGLVHRDIKPANVLLCDDGRVKVADFGIAKATEGSDLTTEGLMLGTAKYLAPEQVRGGPVDARTDLYSLGIVLYEMLCGRPPFQGDTHAATALARLQSDPLRPRQVRAGIPRTLEAIVLRAMAREPAHRYGSASDLRAALLAAGAGDAEPDDSTMAVTPAVATTDATAARPSFTQTERSWLVPTVLIVLAAVAIGVAGLLLSRSGASDLFDRVRDAVGAGGKPEPVKVTAAAAFDPYGTGGENDELAQFVIDGDATTGWRSERYDDRDITALKPGVGLIVALARSGDVKELEVASPTPGWRAEVYVADRVQTSFSEWGKPVGRVRAGAAGTTRIEFDDGRGSAVLLWFTYVGDGPVSRIDVSEIRVLA